MTASLPCLHISQFLERFYCCFTGNYWKSRHLIALEECGGQILPFYKI